MQDRNPPTTVPRTIGRVLFALVFVAAGIYHFLEPLGFAALLPHFLPLLLREWVIWITGVVEWILAILLFVPRIRKLTGLIITIYLIAIFPANIYAAIFHIPGPGPADTPPIFLWLRLLAQPLLIWWILWATRPPKNQR
ncbi:hypothetical protein QWJ34_00140 [Saccharibacillus sp. CPCC 101409]|uniref:DoxX family protein n=1 Tax=Saccharibacillus sp. CPCC 101409 TaxID=3058041 RepID=UPI0026723188|nr:MauE/DoxX family redox-associated membrane protein [Saccharibacillus sp. CPCC 101409]MDO3408165.1 hypothetical protein [Saccharibacillus sp. CPCC 101409]